MACGGRLGAFYGIFPKRTELGVKVADGEGGAVAVKAHGRIGMGGRSLELEGCAASNPETMPGDLYVPQGQPRKVHRDAS